MDKTRVFLTLAISKQFRVPLLIIIGIIVYLLFLLLKLPQIAVFFAIFSISLGSYELLKESVISLRKRQFAIDYIAILAISVAIITREYLVAAILSLMIVTGRTLEEYGVSQAKKSLTKLIERIPQEVTLWENNSPTKKAKIENVDIGTYIFVKKGEVIALDGILESETALTDESSLTGEPYTLDKAKGDKLRSGTINIGNTIVIKVTQKEKDSTYKKIIEMVKRAQNEKSSFVRLADKYSALFTIVTLSISGLTYLLGGGDLVRVLAILAIATPCPLIIATPIALLGGVNSASKSRIIVKRLASLEKLSSSDTIIFDKTGTITLGKPKVTKVEIIDKSKTLEKVLGIASSLERNSLHPLAKAITAFSKEKKAQVFYSKDVLEKVGVGISGTVDGKKYSLSKLKDGAGMQIALFHDKKKQAVFFFEDEIKEDSKEIIERLKRIGLGIFIFTGDKKEAALKVSEKLGGIEVKAECTPKDKQDGIKDLQKKGKTVVMVGDGINDAPALALSDVGLVFSNEEQTAASEAADIVFLGGDFSLVLKALKISKRTIAITMQSIFWGIGISILGMIFASFGFITPLYGAGLQEIIDVAVILNALRASK